MVVQEKGNRCHGLFITFRIRKYRFFFGSPNYKIRPTNSKIGNCIQAEHSCIAKSININILHQVRWSHIHRRQQITSKQRVSPSRPPPRPILSPRNLRTHASSLLNGRHGRFYHGFGKKGMLSLFGGVRWLVDYSFLSRFPLIISKDAPAFASRSAWVTQSRVH